MEKILCKHAVDTRAMLSYQIELKYYSMLTSIFLAEILPKSGED